VIVTKTGGLAEIVEDGLTGLQYELGDIIDLVKKIEILISDKHFAMELAERAFNWAKPRFEKERYGKELYEQLAMLKHKG
jgi:glycosyltransferase involved in cell wall biosynthesis